MKAKAAQAMNQEKSKRDEGVGQFFDQTDKEIAALEAIRDNVTGEYSATEIVSAIKELRMRKATGDASRLPPARLTRDQILGEIHRLKGLSG